MNRIFQILGGALLLFVAICIYVVAGDTTWEVISPHRFNIAGAFGIAVHRSNGWQFYASLILAFLIGAGLALAGAQLILRGKQGRHAAARQVESGNYEV